MQGEFASYMDYGCLIREGQLVSQIFMIAVMLHSQSNFKALLWQPWT